MTTPAIEYLEAIEDLSPGAVLTVHGLSWSEYQGLLADLGDDRSVRLTYDRGKLEAMSPSSKHERSKEFLSHLARIAAIESGCDLESLGSTTQKQQWKDRGAEPDACFYVQNAARIIGKSQIDLRTDPPPDIVVEIDLSHQSPSKLEIYSAMGINELWRYDGQRLSIYHLTGKVYVEAESSLAFPILTARLLSEFIKKSHVDGQSAALRAFQARIRN
ncbi:MAG TPA: Uma2 family endonuclease [Blastocatellia bacterium]